MISLSRLQLLLWTIRYLRPRQVWSRTRRNLRRAWWSARRRRPPGVTGWNFIDSHALYAGLPDVLRHGPWQVQVEAALQRAADIAGQQFCFLNRRATFSSAPGWHDPNLSRLWRYHLHYFDYVQDLLVWGACGQEPAAYKVFRAIADSWMDCNGRICGDGWHPYTISLRVVNWLHALSAFGRQLGADVSFRSRLLDSLRSQSTILARDLETDVGGNHLLANLRALVMTAISARGREPEAWSQSALALLEQELAEQVLADGGHFERSPGYHVTVARHCLETALTLRRNGREPPAWLDLALRRMLDYLVAILPPDSRLPLLKDTTWDDEAAPSDLLAAGALYLQDPAYKTGDTFGLYPLLLFGSAGWEKYKSWPTRRAALTSVLLKTSGHCIARDDSKADYMILDVGKPCPDHLPAHAHADLLSYELMVAGCRIVVDSGVYEYTAGPWRDYFRSTRAHNTVEVGGTDQSEVWDSFRVARRARPDEVYWHATDLSVVARSSHDGYRRLRPRVTHRRTVMWLFDRFWLILDELLGEGSTPAASHVHFHPDLSLSPRDESTWQIEGCQNSLWITAFGEQEHRIVRGQTAPVRQGWCSERFGRVAENTVLTLSRAGALPFSLGYVISKQGPSEVLAVASPAGQRIIVRHGGLEFRLEVPGSMPPSLA